MRHAADLATGNEIGVASIRNLTFHRARRSV
jgi:hypothetical protein